MSLFSPKDIKEKEKQKKLPTKSSSIKKNNDFKDYIPSKEEEETIDKILDQEKFKFDNPTLRSFAKYYILTKSGPKALDLCGITGYTETSRNAMASRMLRQLKDMPMFWDMIGLGYNDFVQLIEELKITKPEYVASLFLKLNKLDSITIQHSGSISIKFEKDLDE